MEKPKLKACPFCGNEFVELRAEDKWEAYIECPRCRARGPLGCGAEIDETDNLLDAVVDAVNGWNGDVRLHG